MAELLGRSTNGAIKSISVQAETGEADRAAGHRPQNYFFRSRQRTPSLGPVLIP
jgi:hypothetical protein